MTEQLPWEASLLASCSPNVDPQMPQSTAPSRSKSTAQTLSLYQSGHSRARKWSCPQAKALGLSTSKRAGSIRGPSQIAVNFTAAVAALTLPDSTSVPPTQSLHPI